MLSSDSGLDVGAVGAGDDDEVQIRGEDGVARAVEAFHEYVRPVH